MNGRGFTGGSARTPMSGLDIPLQGDWETMKAPERPDHHFEVRSPSGRVFMICGKCKRWTARGRWGTTKDTIICDHMIAPATT